MKGVNDWLDCDSFDTLLREVPRRKENPTRCLMLAADALRALVSLDVAPVFQAIAQLGYAPDLRRMMQSPRFRRSVVVQPNAEQSVELFWRIADVFDSPEAEHPVDAASRAARLMARDRDPLAPWLGTGMPAHLHLSCPLRSRTVSAFELLSGPVNVERLRWFLTWAQWVARCTWGDTTAIILFRRRLVALVKSAWLPPHRLIGARGWHRKFSREWRTDTVLALARQMWQAREYSAMPILADALQDAGCDHRELLEHCRDTTQVHSRASWALWAALGLEAPRATTAKYVAAV